MLWSCEIVAVTVRGRCLRETAAGSFAPRWLVAHRPPSAVTDWAMDREERRRGMSQSMQPIMALYVHTCAHVRSTAVTVPS